MRNHRLYLGARMAHRHGLLAAVSQSDKPRVRPSWTGIQRGAHGMALAIACASSLQLCGCLGNAGRDLTADLDKDAGRASLSVERELARRKEERAKALSADLTAQVKQADADDRDLAETSVEPAGWFSFRESPLRKMLQRRPETKPEAGDPFLNAPAPEAAQQVARIQTEAPAGQPAAKVVPAAKEATVAKGVVERQPSRTESAPDWDKLLKDALDSADRTGQQSLSRRTDAGASDEDHWSNAFSNGNRGDTTETEPIAQSDKSGGTDDVERRKQKMRVQALMSEARTHALRGELHAAYRSALLANQIVEQHGLEVDPAKNPRELAQQFADRIWQVSDEMPEPEKAGSDHSVQSEVAHSTHDKTPETDPIKHDAIFSESTTFTRWQPLPTVAKDLPADGSPEPESGNQLAQSSLPEIPTVRPARLMPELPSPDAIQPAPARQKNRASRRLPSDTVEQSKLSNSHPAQRPFPADAEGVTFAIAQNVEELDKDAAAPPNAPEFPDVAGPLSAPEPPLESEGPLLSAHAGSQAGKGEEGKRERGEGKLNARHSSLNGREMAAWGEGLASPLVSHESEETVAVPANGMSPRTGDDRGATAGSAAAAPRSLRWGVFAFIAAVLATIIGLRLFRLRRDDEADPAEQPATDATEPETMQRLRIKRAA
jgi:hypothetical protein